MALWRLKLALPLVVEPVDPPFLVADRRAKTAACLFLATSTPQESR
jgi:hypothetical protein